MEISMVSNGWAYAHFYAVWLMMAVLYVFAFVAAVHVLLAKRDPRSALGWVVVCLGFPGLGALAYVLFGINRIQMRARRWRYLLPSSHTLLSGALLSTRASTQYAFVHTSAFRSLMTISTTVSQSPIFSDCEVHPLYNGEEAYPQMLAAIESATHYVYLATYIFDMNSIGERFALALQAAVARGVDVRVLIDGIGCLYSWPTAYRVLKKKGVPVARFLPLSLSRRTVHLNLRNHRKLLIIDRKIGFTGGMNIGDRHMAANMRNRRRVCDIHFAVHGPVLRQMEEIFLKDWAFAVGRHDSNDLDKNGELEALSPPASHDLRYAHTVTQALCRGISAGPSEIIDKLKWIVIGAFASASHIVRVMTPYFIPDADMVSAINTAVFRGVTVEIIVPDHSNLRYVDWASRAMLWEMLQYGVKFYAQPAPFAHSKLLMVDDFYALIGSANLDPRSLRLNFEFNLEVYSTELTAELTAHFKHIKSCSRLITLSEIAKEPILIKLRNAVAKLFSPYL